MRPTREQRPFGSPQFVQTIERFETALRVAEADLNDLNVFPVADHDTGTNLLATIAGVAGQLDPSFGSDEMIHAVARASLTNAKGNSGLIVGQYLTGFTRHLGVEFDGSDLRLSLDAGAALARRSVGNPVEGTILTVADVAARAASSSSLSRGIHLAVDAAARAVEETRGQLEVLADAGVVDAGARGLLLFLRSLHDVVHGSGVVVTRDAADDHRVFGASTASVVGWEIMFEMTGDGELADDVRARLEVIGTDVVVGEADGLLVGHVHVGVEDLEAARGTIEAWPGARSVRHEPLAVS